MKATLVTTSQVPAVSAKPPRQQATRSRGDRRFWATIVLIPGLVLGLAACKHSSAPAHSQQSSHSSHAAHATLELNDGKKWIVAEPMMAHMRSLEKAVNDFESAPNQNHAALAVTVQENLGRLVTNCTMEGKAHDELHKWLMPFLGLSANYTMATDPQVQQQQFQEIKRSLLVFNSYFE